MSSERRPHDRLRSSIDWTAVHRRLEDASAALAHTETSEEVRKRTLRSRAAALAREEQRDTQEEHLPVLEFLLAHERYAVDIDCVREVQPLESLTPLPAMPAFVMGIISVRGRIVSIVDLKSMFDLPANGLTDLNKVVIMSNERMEFGVLADALCGVRSLPVSQIRPAPPTLTGKREEYLRGVTAERLIVLDAAKLLGDPRMTVRQSPIA